jgi:Mg2+-importing ATPase
MLAFGLLSSLFDFLTFAVLIWWAVPEAVFRTGWFVESLLTELLVALIVRTQRPFYRSRPGRLLTATSLGLVVVAIAVPYVPGGALIGFAPLPASLLGVLLGITASYVLAAELLKHGFYRWWAAP